MKLFSYLKASILSLAIFASNAYSMESPYTIDKVNLENTPLVKSIEQANHNLVKHLKTNVLPENEKERVKYWQKLWDRRIEDVKKGLSELLYVHKETTSICAIFFYPCVLIPKYRVEGELYESVNTLVNVGFVPMTQNKQEIPLATDALTQYGVKNYPTLDFLAYMPKDCDMFDALLKRQDYTAVDLEGARLEPVNQLSLFTPDLFNWYLRKASK